MAQNVSPELLQTLSEMIASAIRQSTAQTQHDAPPAPAQPRPPQFSMPAYRATDGTTIADYFTRFTWALELSKIPENEHAQYARVYMGTELNDSLKILVSPKNPENLSYSEIQSKLTEHLDATRNKYAESIKFRSTMQRSGEPIAGFTLRLRQAATYCEYGTFLDRMLIEQFIKGLESRDMCDEIIAKKPESFTAAYEIAHALEATRNTANEVKAEDITSKPDSTHRIGYEKPPSRKSNNQRPLSWSTSRQQNANQSRPRQGSHQSKQTTSEEQPTCAGCGGDHARSQCRFFDAECRNCGKKGHIARVCRCKPRQRRTNQVTEETEEELPADYSDTVYFGRIETIGKVQSPGRQLIDVNIEGTTVKMELDTGAPCSIIDKSKLSLIKPNFTLQKTDRLFASYTGHCINCIGKTLVTATIGTTSRNLNLYVVDAEFETLLGREWISEFVREIDFECLFAKPESIHNLATEPSLSQDQQKELDATINRFQDVFSDLPGKLSGPQAKMHLKSGATPIFARARDVPVALRDAYAKEIDAKIASGFYKRVEYSEWASTTHVVAKKNGKLRITGNYKPTLNPRIIIDEHPIPKVENLFNRMRGATLFCHLDVTDAYTHLEVDDEFSHALTLNTPTHGLIRPTRAVYGAANIPAIWQRRMDTVLQGLENVVSFFDDTIVFATNSEKLIEALSTTLERFRQHGLKLNRAKCKFAEPVLEALGHKIDGTGIHKSDAHIRAVRDAPKPTTPEELQLFLGKATYYSAFIPDLSTKDRPLRDMLLNDPLVWTPAGEKAYKDLKDTLTSPQILMQYDPSLPLLLATDASKTGLGAVLSHRLSNGRERPIAYASRTMSATEQRYPQIDKEALAIVWAAQKFFKYLYARHFTLITDHKPLTQILHPEKSLPVLCISRMANYADYLAHFDYDVLFKKSKANANADYCSRAPLLSTIHAIKNSISLQREEVGGFDDFDFFAVHQMQQLPVRSEAIARETRRDLHLGRIVKLLETGQDLARHDFKAPEVKYTLAANCLMFEHRVVVPPALRNAILKDLHTAHLGIVKMKGMARSFVFWPGIDSDIDNLAKSCTTCASHAHAPPKFRDHHWEYPKAPWERIHIDYAGPVADTMLLIVVDAYSKWLEVKPTTTTTAAATIALMDDLFTAHGSPVTVVSDNGRQFVAEEFKEFLKGSGVKYHKLTAPYHPSTNGQAERYVQTVKDALNAMKTTKGLLRTNLNEFLRQFRKAPHSTTGQSPAQLFLGRELRTRLNLVRPDDVHTRVSEKQRTEMDSTFRTLKVGQAVYFLSGNPNLDKWVPGTVIDRLGDLHYSIQFGDKKVKRHIDQIRSFPDNKPQSEPEAKSAQIGNGQPSRRLRYHDTVEARAIPVTPAAPAVPTTPVTPSTPATPLGPRQLRLPAPRLPYTPQNPRRSSRTRAPPSRFSPS